MVVVEAANNEGTPPWIASLLLPFAKVVVVVVDDGVIDRLFRGITDAEVVERGDVTVSVLIAVPTEVFSADAFLGLLILVAVVVEAMFIDLCF